MSARTMGKREREWVERLKDQMTPDVLDRLTHSEYDYYSSHGHYVPGLAKLARHYHDEIAVVERERDELNGITHSLRGRLEVAEREREWIGALGKALNEQNERLVRERDTLRAALEQIERTSPNWMAQGDVIAESERTMRQIAHDALAAVSPEGEA